MADYEAIKTAIDINLREQQMYSDEEGVEQEPEEGLKEGLGKTLRAVMTLGLLTDEQLALVTKQVETE